MDLRRRTPFKFVTSEDSDDGAVFLDDQEQEEVIESLREETAKSNKRSTFMMQIHT
ncbi:uncharacterized protein C8R40DRAFT_1093389 [Lentinula edodes]|uniref:uncharacterized protein n=1 Tax=Lentinula edodes TaxID=5353 RepID=UPI001E8E30E7|nr:uncharacterized protein C8R40DRAFT_1093389 [Lentinula edodes]KAH7878008.1 hypothetical protein C8R40DRAFT_1093389 [Lentinula edodes]